AATARVGPMVQVDAEHAVLVLDVALPDDLERSAKPWELVPDSEHHPYAGLLSRLQVLDLGEAAVEEPLDVDGFTASSWFGREAGRQVGYAAYGPQTEPSVAVVVPHGDVVEVPVVDLGRLTDERGPRSRKAVSEASAWLLEGDPEHGRSRGGGRGRRRARGRWGGAAGAAGGAGGGGGRPGRGGGGRGAGGAGGGAGGGGGGGAGGRGGGGGGRGGRRGRAGGRGAGVAAR